MRRIKKILCLVLATGLTAVCFGAPESAGADPPETGAQRIAIGTETWPGYIALYVAQSRGYFIDEGLDVDIRRYISLDELSRDYVSGMLQGRANLVLETVKEAFQGTEHRIVLAIDFSSGADAIVARADIMSLPDLKGKRVAFEHGTLEEFFIGWALAGHEMGLGDIVPVSADPAEAVRMLREGTVDAAVSHEPFLSEILHDANLHAVYTSRDAPGLITDVLTFHQTFLDDHPGEVRAIVRAYFRALDFVKDHPGEAHAILAREFGISPDEVARQMAGLILLDREQNHRHFQFHHGIRCLFVQSRQLYLFLQSQQSGGRTFNPDELIDPTFLLKGEAR